MSKGRKTKEEMKDVKIIKNEIDLKCNKRYFLLNLTTDERWIVEISDRNWEKGPECYEVYYKIISTNTSTKIGDSLGEFIEDNNNIVVELENEDHFEQFQNRDIEINGRCQYCQKLLYVGDEVWTDPDDGSAICEDCYEDRLQEKDAEESK